MHQHFVLWWISWEHLATDIFLIFFPSTALTLVQTTSFYKQPLKVLLTLSGCQENKFFSVATEDVLAHNHLVKYTFKYSVYYPCSGPTAKSTNSGGYPMLNLPYIAQWWCLGHTVIDFVLSQPGRETKEYF